MVDEKVGETVANFSQPVCNIFNPRLFEGQLCYSTKLSRSTIHFNIYVLSNINHLKIPSTLKQAYTAISMIGQFKPN